ncbi:MAG: histidine kinase [Polyangiales bacterium]
MSRAIALDRPLPAELLRRNHRGLAAYSVYPVFSWPWLRRRSLLVTLGAATFGVLLAIAGVATKQDFARYWSVPLHFTLGVLGISSVGPLLATLVRQASWRPVVERRSVMACIAVGVLCSCAIDIWASGAIELGMASGPRGHAERPALGWLVLNIVVLTGLYALVGGGLALRRYLGEERGIVELAKESELATLRAEKNALDMRLSMLQAQIEPHFLFNTLASVRSLIGSDPTLAATTIELLVDYLRATIPRLRESELDSTLGQQLEICESYLRLMCVRISRLRFRVEVDASLRARRFPALLLITLVENALKHGIEPKVGPGTVVISAAERGGRLQVNVVDDGVGLRDSCGSGLGLRNLREQLHARYGEQASFTLSGAASGGAHATLELP